MSRPRFRAWRFQLPRLGASRDTPERLQSYDASEAGVSLSAGGGIEMVEEEESVRQAILLLLGTVPGERVMRPDYGCDLHRLVFSPLTIQRRGWQRTTCSARWRAGSPGSRSCTSILLELSKTPVGLTFISTIVSGRHSELSK